MKSVVVQSSIAYNDESQPNILLDFLKYINCCVVGLLARIRLFSENISLYADAMAL